MIAFGGFMQVNSDLLQAVAGQTNGAGKAKHGLGQLIGQASETTSEPIRASFLDSIRQLMHDEAIEQMENKMPPLPGKPADNPLSSVFDPLQNWIADNMDLSATELAELMAASGIGPNGASEVHAAIDMLALNPGAGNQPSGNDPGADRTAAKKMGSSVKWSGTNGSMQTDASGKGSTAKRPPMDLVVNQHGAPAFNDDHRRGRYNGFSSTVAVKKPVEQTTGALRGSAVQATTAMRAGGEANQGNLRINPGRAFSNQDPLEASTRVATGVVDNNGNDQINLGRALSSQASVEASTRMTTTVKAGETEVPREPISVLETTSGQSSAASDEDGAAQKNRDARPAVHRLATAVADEPEWHKAQSSDGSKNTTNDAVRAQAPIDGTPKSMLADKPSSVHALDPARSEPTVARHFQMAVMDQIVDKANLRSIHGRSEIQIRLKPEFLGNVQMTVSTDKAQLVVRILTDQPVVKEVIESHLHQLKSELQNQGLTIDKFDIMVNPDADHQPNRDQFSQMFKNHHFQHGRRQSQEREPEQMHPDDDQSSGEEKADDGVNYFA